MNNDPLLVALQLLIQKITDLPAEIVLENSQYQKDLQDYGVVSAFGRPQPVIVMGPNPLPVTGDSGGGGLSSTSRQRPGTAPAQAGEPAVTRVYVANENWAAPVPVRMVGGGPAGEKESKADKGGGGLPGFGQVLARFAAVAGPAAVLGTVLGSATSGFQTLGAAVKVLSATIAPVLLPATILLSTAFVAASDVLTGSMPALEGFFSIILSLGIPVLITFIDFLKQAAEWASKLPKNERGEVTKGSFLKELFNARLGPAAFGAGIDIGVEEGGGKAPKRDQARDTVLSALRDTVKSFSLSVGPKAQISGLEGVGRSAQLAALNQDPLEARMLKTQQQILGILERAIAGLGGGGGVYTPGTGATGGTFSGYVPPRGSAAAPYPPVA